MGVVDKEYGLSANGSTGNHNIPVSGDYMFYGVGTFGGGTLILEASPDKGVSWFTVDVLYESGRLIRYLVSGEIIRISLSGATAPSITTGIRQ